MLWLVNVGSRTDGIEENIIFLVERAPGFSIPWEKRILFFLRRIPTASGARPPKFLSVSYLALSFDPVSPCGSFHFRQLLPRLYALPSLESYGSRRAFAVLWPCFRSERGSSP